MNKLMQDYARKPVVPVGQVNGVTADDVDEEFSSSSEDESDPREYEHEFVEEELKRYAQSSKTAEAESDPYGLSEVEGVEGYEYKNNPLNIYKSYNFGTKMNRRELPIDSFKDKILNMLAVNPVIVIQGPTGCGKTTQVPQFIIDRCKENQEYCNIAVTQPRKIATLTVAKRVCEERAWQIGTVCGYQVGLEKKLSPDMILTYMTTGVLLQKLIRAKTLNHFTHIIIDEVHERDAELDFLLLIVRRFLYTQSARTKVILMSATIDANEFAYYFRSHSVQNSRGIPAPIIQVNKKSDYSNTVFYLNNLNLHHNLEEFDFDIDKPQIPQKMWEAFILLVNVIDKVDEIDPATNRKIIGSVLVFLPGIHEIEEASRRLTENQIKERVKEKNEDGSSKPIWQVVPLHSTLPNDEQAAAFLPAKAGHRKIILSTNIAESSVTVPDTYYVIDFCQTKVMVVEPTTKYMSLKLEWASHVNCNQRAGRVGRIANGRVYRLVPRSFYFEKMSDKSVPDMLKAPLESVVLKAKMLNFHETPQQILALAINPPNLKNIEATILALKEMGGLLQTCRGKYTACDGDISFMGTVMSQLPIDPRLAKLIVLGHLFSCLTETVIIAAGCSIQNIFATPFQKRFEAYKKLLLWADGSFSDLIALLNLYQVWQSLKRDNQFDNHHAELRWCSLNMVNYKGLKEWQLLVTEITQRLERMNVTNIQGQLHLNQHEKPLILKILTAGAFYPNFFVKEPFDIQNTERDAVKAVGGRDPLRTVFLTGMDPTQPGPLYVRFIKDFFKTDRDVERQMAIGFDGSSKIYIEFKSFNSKRDHVTVSVNGREMITDALPGSIPNAVYEAIRRRQLQQKFTLKLLPLQEAWSYAESKGIERKTTLQKFKDISASRNAHMSERNCYSEEPAFDPIPTLDTEWIAIKLTEFIDAGHFWTNTLESEVYLTKIEDILNKVVLHGVIATGESIKLGKMYAAKYTEDNVYYRCQVISLGPNITQVIFVDYGNIQQVRHEDLCVLPDAPECKMPPLGLECVLHGIKPSRKTNPKGVWTETINAYWKNQLFGLLLYGKVHSVVDNVVSLELYKTDPNNRTAKTINETMIGLGHAEVAAESFLSKADHEKRLTVKKAENPIAEAMRLTFDQVQIYQDVDAPQMDSYQCKTIEVKGPYSPLEMKMYGIIQSAGEKSVEIEGTSVNTVLLDSEPQNYFTRLLVAGYVSESQTGNRLRLRQTTLMPNSPGLPMLLTLIFCPRMKPKITDDGTRVASILCGLGHDIHSKKPFYPDHDLTLSADTMLTEDDINKINKIRYHMSQGVQLMHRISTNMADPNEMVHVQIGLRKELLSLLHTTRTPVDRQHVKFATSWSKSNVEALLLQPPSYENSEDIWPLLWFVRLKSCPLVDSNTSKNLDDLDLMARQMLPVNEAKCILCNVALLTIHEVRLHLISQLHKDKLQDYHRKLEEKY